MELSNPDDPTFLMFSDIDSNLYESVIKSQRVSVPYDQFLPRFLSILDRISDSVDGLSDLFTLEWVLTVIVDSPFSSN